MHLRSLFARRQWRLLVALLVAMPVVPAPAHVDAVSASQPRPASRLERLEIKSRFDAFGGLSFGPAGQYEAIVAVAHGQLDPADAANARIVDLDKAPRTNGLVEYETDVVILRPKDPLSARRVLFYDVVNRGNKIALTTYFNEGNGDLTSPEGAGNGFLMRQGYTVVFSGWQGDLPLSGDGSRIGTRFPVATNPDGSPITGLSREEIVFDNTTNPGRLTLTWPAADLDPAQAMLRAKVHQNDDWRPVPTWSYLDDKTVQIDRPADLDAGSIYEFIYTARDPKVMGIGMAAVRDLVSFLEYETADGQGNLNPLNDLRGAPCEAPGLNQACPENPATTVDVAIIEGISQSGRFTRDFLWQGFNADPSGRQVFNGAMPLIGGSRKTWTNFRFAQPGRWSKQHEDHLQAGDQFPFTYATITDPISGMDDGLLAQCSATNTCPRVMQLDGSGEFWLARASLLVSDGAGNEVPLPDNVRLYQMTGTPHGYSQTRVSNSLPAC
ncbi:MAG: alpha/beta hydrolase domain-containing protein, partial [Chloroflexota bacterium]|nr:alpha/beta hydrolase domain-containing protein [Chloroflexota bacterium]